MEAAIAQLRAPNLQPLVNVSLDFFKGSECGICMWVRCCSSDAVISSSTGWRLRCLYFVEKKPNMMMMNSTDCMSVLKDLIAAIYACICTGVCPPCQDPRLVSRMGAAEDCSLLVLPGTGQCGLTQLISPREAARFVVTRPSSGAVRLDPATALPALKVTPSRNMGYVSEGGFDSDALLQSTSHLVTRLLWF